MVDTQTSDKYETPQVSDYGTLTELTAGQKAGAFLDAGFGPGTPVGDLGFSNTR